MSGVTTCNHISGFHCHLPFHYTMFQQYIIYQDHVQGRYTKFSHCWRCIYEAKCHFSMNYYVDLSMVPLGGAVTCLQPDLVLAYSQVKVVSQSSWNCQCHMTQIWMIQNVEAAWYNVCRTLVITGLICSEQNVK